MNAEGDIADVAAVMNDLVGLMTFIKQNIDGIDVGLLRAGRRGDFLSRAFGKFTDDEWAKFESITTLDLSTSKYELQARRVFGTAFIEYKNGVQVKTLAELRAAVGQEDFYKTLEGYMAGITPAFSYGMNE